MPIPFTIIDLTHTLSPEIPTWSGGCGFRHELKQDYSDCKGKVKFCVQQIKMHAGIGTHMDAPSHSFENALSIADIPLDQLVSPCVVVDVSDKAHERYLVSVDDLKPFEKMLKHSFVIIRTGWERFWHDPERYVNNHIFPGVSKEAAQYLLDKQISGLGIDTISPDNKESDFPVHELLLGNGKYIVENVAHSERLPSIGSYAFALPIKVQGGTEAPIRLIAIILSN